MDKLRRRLHAEDRSQLRHQIKGSAKIENFRIKNFKPLDCINNKNSEKLLGLLKEEISKANYGLAHVADEYKAKEMLQGLYDVLRTGLLLLDEFQCQLKHSNEA